MIKQILSKLLRQTADDIEKNKYECSEEEWMNALNTVNSMNPARELSKEEACKYLNIPRSTFDTYIRNGWIPKGEKHLGFKELSWTKSDLDTSKNRIRKMLINNQLQA